MKETSVFKIWKDSNYRFYSWLLEDFKHKKNIKEIVRHFNMLSRIGFSSIVHDDCLSLKRDVSSRLIKKRLKETPELLEWFI